MAERKVDGRDTGQRNPGSEDPQGGKDMIRRMTWILSGVLVLAALGCVERKMTVTSNPPGARVYLDDQEMGQTPVTFRFDFYGHRTFTLKKDATG